MTLKILRANLIEIAQSQGKKQKLIASLDGKRVYSRSFFWGRLLVILTFWRNQDKALTRALARIQKSFAHEIKHLETARAEFFKAFGEEVQGKPHDGHKKGSAHIKLLHFAMRFKPLMKDVIKDRASHFECVIGKDPEAIAQLKSLFRSIALCRKIKDFELVTKCEFPGAVLFKLASDDPLTDKEKSVLEKWIAHIQNSDAKAVTSLKGPFLENPYKDVRFIHRMLFDLVKFYQEIDPKKKVLLGRLEARLYQHGLTVFEQPDNALNKKRCELLVGERIKCDGETYVLGDILANEIRDHRYPVVFEVQGNPEIELVFNHNEAWMHLQDFEEQVVHCGILMQQRLAADEVGSLQVRERLFAPLNSIEWQTDLKSLENEVTKQDEMAAQPVVLLLKSLVQLTFTPFPLLPNMFFFNAKGAMRAKDCLIPGDKSFERLEEFAFLTSQDPYGGYHPSVFNHLMKESGLSKTNEALEYHELVRRAASGYDAKMIVTGNGSIGAPELLKARGDLCNRIIDIKYNTAEAVHFNYEGFKESELFSAIEDAICKIHLEYSPGTILHPNFEQLVYKEVLKSLKPQLKKNPLLKAKKALDDTDKSATLDKKQDEAVFQQLGIYNPKQMKRIRKESKLSEVKK